MSKRDSRRFKAALQRIKQREANQKSKKNNWPIGPTRAPEHRKEAGAVVGFIAQMAVDVQGASLIISNTVGAQGRDTEYYTKSLNRLKHK